MAEDTEHQYRDVRQWKIDRAYTPKRIRILLEDYHALLDGVAPPDDERGIGQVTRPWSARVEERIARKIDMDEAIAKSTSMLGGAVLRWRYRLNEGPGEPRPWSVVASQIGVSERHAFRLWHGAIQDISRYLGGLEDR